MEFCEISPEPLPPNVKIVFFTPFGFSKPSALCEKETKQLSSSSNEVSQWAEFGPGEQYPTIVFKFDKISTDKKKLQSQLSQKTVGMAMTGQHFFTTVADKNEEAKVNFFKENASFNLPAMVR